MSTEDPTGEPQRAPSAKRDSRKLTPTRTPGVYKRGNRYVAVFRAGGRQVKRSAPTLDAARRIKREAEADRDRGEWQERTTVTLRAYLGEWIDAYQGTGRRGFREGTREEYRRLLDQYAHAFFSERLRLVDVTPKHLAQFVAWLCDEDRQGKRLSDSSVANAAIPVRAALSTALREGMIRSNPSAGLALPHREQVREDDEEDAKALSREQLRLFLALAPERHRLMFETLASTGLRVSEVLGLQRRHVLLDGSSPCLRVRRAIVRRRVEPPKTKHGRREVPLSPSLVFKLRAHLADLPDSPEALIFAAVNGSPLDPDNLRARVVKPLAEEVGAPWAAFHTLRHTYASLQIAQGCNIVQLSRVLGHHSPAFTLTVYTHLLKGEEAPALELVDVLDPGQSRGNVPHGSQTSDAGDELAQIGG